ncbi:MAG: TolC family protein [Deltaproteobacteria bacterium]|nr:TolC family protein [Deltaproteobacteria bacterium]
MAESSTPETEKTPPSAEEESTPPQVDSASKVETHPGNCPEDHLALLRTVCESVEAHYKEVLTALQTLKASEAVLKKFQARQGGIGPEDVEQAKNQYGQAKQSYIQAGNEINEGIKKIHPLAKSYPQDRVVQNLYKAYLAKLLVSLETHNEPEPFMDLLAMSDFHFERGEVTLTEKEKLRMMTVEDKQAELLATATKMVTLLECRYQKRLLQNSIRGGLPPQQAIQRLKNILYRDPEDLRTHIWLANLTNEIYLKERNQNKKVALRDDILSHCKKAFGMIDDYLTLQGIESLPERDRHRAGFVKTITQIRKPLMS